MSLRFKLCLLAWIAVVAGTSLIPTASGQELTPLPVPGPAANQDSFADDNWVMDIRPAAKVLSQQQVTIPGDSVAVGDPVVAGEPIATLDDQHEGCGRLHASAADYTRVYAAIPFNRAEYNVNPSYRHDSTMEILTGNARHQTIVRHNTTSALTVAPRGAAFARNPYGFRNPNGYGDPYSYGYLRPALRLNYYKYFPSLNPYLNVWNLSGAY